jgi:hypothetical protein
MNNKDKSTEEQANMSDNIGTTATIIQKVK